VSPSSEADITDLMLPLIELAIVVATIGILTVIAIPYYVAIQAVARANFALAATDDALPLANAVHLKANHFEWAHLVRLYTVTTHSAEKTYKQAYKELALILGRGDMLSGEVALIAEAWKDEEFTFLLDRAHLDLVELFFNDRVALPEQSTILSSWHLSDQCGECAAAYRSVLKLLKNRPSIEEQDMQKLRFEVNTIFMTQRGGSLN
jgi:hypothetical protein